MKRNPFIRTLSLITVWLYSVSLAHAGQVVTQNEKTWARQALEKTDLSQDISKTASPNSVAVLYFNNISGNTELTPLEKGIAVMLITDLSKIDTIQVVERIKLQALIDEMDLAKSGLMDPQTAPKLGHLLGAYYLNSGTIGAGTAAAIELIPTLVDVPFNSTTNLPGSNGELNDLIRMEKEILFSITDQLSIYLTKEEKEELSMPLSASVAALMALFLGIDFSDKGDYTQAASMYQKAIVEDPKLQLAHDSLNELKSLGLIESKTVPRSQSPASNGGSVESGSGSTWLWVVGGLAVVGGGAAIIAGSSSSDSDSSGSSQTTETATAPAATKPRITSTVPAQGSGTVVTCSSGQLQFTFDKAMNTSSNASFSYAFSNSAYDPGWTTSSSSWSSNGVTLLLNYSASNSYSCYSLDTGTMSVTVSGAADIDGNVMDSQTLGFTLDEGTP